MYYSPSFRNEHRVSIIGKLYWCVSISIIGPILYW
jgi:hypothetical protein